MPQPSSVWDPADVEPVRLTLAPAVEPTPPAPIVPIDPVAERLIAIIFAPAPAGMTHRAAHDARERAVIAELEPLTAVEALHLHRRLSNPRSGDALAAAFARMVVERRGRILQFLSDTRRRQALAISPCRRRASGE